MVAATAKPGRCRGIGTGPRSGSCGGRTSAPAVLVAGALAGAAEGGSRDAVKSGGFVVFGLGHAIPRSEEVGALEAALSVGRGGSLAGVRTAGAELPVDLSPVVLALPVIAGEGLTSGSEARLGEPFLNPGAGAGPSIVPVASTLSWGSAN